MLIFPLELILQDFRLIIKTGTGNKKTPLFLPENGKNISTCRQAGFDKDEAIFMFNYALPLPRGSTLTFLCQGEGIFKSFQFLYLFNPIRGWKFYGLIIHQFHQWLLKIKPLRGKI